MKKFFYSIYAFFYTILNGVTPEVDAELKRIEKARNKVSARMRFLEKDFSNNRKELFKLLSIKEMLTNYYCDLTGYSNGIGMLPSLGFNGSANSKMVDEILDPKW